MIQTLPSPRPYPTGVHRSLSNPLELRVRRSLCNSSYRQLQYVRCHCKDGVVLLMGTVPSYFIKQMAQETVRRIAGVTQIDNQVEVVYAEENAQ
ncbi:BON domain-containing protein [Novipirellula rosea]|uniref:BON domain-containing protein n=1 Tax=Novipirellula rosea TaxID=1031540 RepID=UPI003CD0716F